MTVTANAENLRQYKIGLSLIAEYIVVFASHPNIVREVKDVPPNFKLIEWRCFTLLKVFMWIVRSTISLNSKQFHQKLY